MKKFKFQHLNQIGLTLSLCLLILTAGCVTQDSGPIQQQSPLHQSVDKEVQQNWNELASQYENSIEQFSKTDYEVDTAGSLRFKGITALFSGNETEALQYLADSIKMNPASVYAPAVLDFIKEYALYDHKVYEDLMDFLSNRTKTGSLPKWIRHEYDTVLFKHAIYDTGDIRTAESLKEEMNIITGWRILGPFSNVSGSGFNKNYLQKDDLKSFPESAIGLNNWNIEPFSPEYTSPGLYEPLSGYFGEQNYISVYAQKKLTITNDSNYYFIFSKKGAIKIWLDGEEIIENEDYSTSENSIHFYRELSAGEHTITVQSSSREGQAAFSAAYFSTDNSPQIELSSLYKTLFTEISHYDPFINSLCQQTTDTNNSAESLFWLITSLQSKGMIQQSSDVIQIWEESYDDETLAIWFNAVQDSIDGRYPDYQQKMISLAEKKYVFAPARSYALRDFAEDGRIGKLESYISKLDKQYSSWYYLREAKMSLNFLNNNSEEGFIELKALLKDYPNVADYSFRVIDYADFLTDDQINYHYTRIKANGHHIDGLYESYLRDGYVDSAAKKLKVLLDSVPINETLWLEYIEHASESGILNFQSTRKLVKSLINTFPLSHNLLLMEKNHAQSIYMAMEAFKNENADIFRNTHPQITKFLDEMEEEKASYRSALEKYVSYYPISIKSRDELRELNDEQTFTEKIHYDDPFTILENFNSLGRDYENTDAVIVYDDKKEIFFGDGASTVIKTLVIKVLTRNGVKDNRYQYLNFHPVFGNGVVDLAYVVKADGKRIPAEQSGAAIAYPNLEPGDSIVLSYTVHNYTTGLLNNEYWTSFVLESSYPIAERRFSLIYPKDIDLNIQLNAPEGEKAIYSEIKRTSYIQGFSEVEYSVVNKAAKNSTLQSLPWQDRFAWIDISTIDSWDTILQWYTDLYKGQTYLTPELRQAAEEMCADEPTDMGKIGKLFDFVSNKIEYEDLTFLYSNYIPQTAESVLYEGYGDCKDQSVLLISLLEAVGINSHIVLNTPQYTGEHPYLPSPRFTHAIVAVPLSDETTLYLDPTTEYSTFGELSAGMDGVFILEVKDDSDLVKLDNSVTDQKSYYLVELMNILGETRITGNYSYQGYSAAAIRSILADYSPKEQEQRFELISSLDQPGLRLSEITLRNMENLAFDPQIDFLGEVPSIVHNIGRNIYALDLPWQLTPQDSTELWLSQNNAEGPIKVESFEFGTPIVQTMIVEIPNGYRLMTIPESQEFTFNDSYSRFKIEQSGNRIIYTREYYIPYQVISPEEIEDYYAFLGETNRASKQQLYLTK